MRLSLLQKSSFYWKNCSVQKSYLLYLLAEVFKFGSHPLLFISTSSWRGCFICKEKNIQRVSSNLDQIRSWVGKQMFLGIHESWTSKKLWNYLRFYFLQLEQGKINQRNDIMSSKWLDPKLLQFCVHLYTRDRIYFPFIHMQIRWETNTSDI